MRRGPARRFFRTLLLALLMPLPAFLKNPLSRLLLGWEVGAAARIGLSYIDADRVVIGEKTAIGHFNVVRKCREFSVGTGATVMNGNRFFGSDFSGQGWENSLRVGDYAYLTSGHFIDTSGGVSIGEGAVMGGRASQVWSHSVRMVDGRRELIPAPTSLGPGSYIGAGAIVVCASVPGGSLVGAGAVVTKSIPEAEGGAAQLLAGNPATVRKVY